MRTQSFLWICVLSLAALLAACSPIVPETAAPQASSGAQLANPASQNCVDQGGALTIETRGDGGQYGVCTFEDNRQCEEWALFRGQCPVGGVKVTGYATDAARYCAITGGEYQAHASVGSSSDEEQGTCTLPDGTSCDVWEYYNGQCTATGDSASAGAAPSDESVQAQESDPFAYCASVGTDDSPITESTGGGIPDTLVQPMIDQAIVSADAPASIQQAGYWRCMDGSVWVCVVGANLPCAEKADTSETATPEMDEYCASNPGAGFIPAAVTGRATVYTWTCDDKTAVVDKQVFTPDEQGYLSDFWTELTPPQ